MKPYLKYSIIATIIIIAICLTYLISEVYQFTNGINDDTKHRDSVLKTKGIRLDSMGYVNDSDFNKTKAKVDSLNERKVKNNGRL